MKTNKSKKIFVLVFALLGITLNIHAKNLSTRLTNTESIVWDITEQLPGILSDTEENLGLAGVYSGMVNDLLVVAGGANFPYALPDKGGIKIWHNDVYVKKSKDEWKCWDNIMPMEMAYGFTVQTTNGLLLIGGCNSQECFSDVWELSLDDSNMPIFKKRPSLPIPLANMAGGVIDGKVYLAGGVSSMTEQKTLNTFISYDINTGETKILPSWNGKSRAYAVGAIQSDGLDNCFYIFSGREYYKDSKWDVLTDGWKYNPRLNEWSLVDGIFPVMAGSAVAVGSNHILLLGGRYEDQTKDNNSIRLYHSITGTLIEQEVKDVIIPVTTNAFINKDEIIITSGEIAPGVRTPVIIKGRLVNNIKKMSYLDILVIILYFSILAWMGWHFSKKQKSTDDYFKGGGRIPWFIVGLSIFGTGLSAITFMSIPAKAYSTDWSYMLFNAGIVLVVPLITGFFIPYFRKLNVTTAYEYLEGRFSPIVRIVCSLAFIIYQVGRMGVVLLLPSIALNVVTGFNIFLCISLMGVLALIYTYMGGIEAVAWTDALQVVVLLGAAFAIVVSICLSLPNGIQDVITIATQNDKFNIGSMKFDLRQSTIWTVLIATVFTNITTYGTDQTIVQRYLTTKTEKEAKKGVYTNAILCIPATLLFFFVGTCIYVFFKNNPAELSSSINNADAILPWYVSIHIPPGLLGLVIAGIFAAAMSTISASMNSAATAYVTDIHVKIFKKTDTLKIAKISTIIIGTIGLLFAIMMATWDIKSLWDEFSKILGVLLGGLGGLFILAFTYKKANSIGAIVGLAGSMIVQLVVMHFRCINLLLYSAVGFISCYVIGFLVSKLTEHHSHK